MFIEILKFIFYSGLIVVISKYILATNLRKLAENLNLKAKTVGELAGYATSVPEFLTIIVSSFSGLIGASIYNILSSNIINFVQYLISIFMNKNQKTLRNRAIKVDLILVGFTIVIPIILSVFNLVNQVILVPIFLLLYLIFRYCSKNVHNRYLKKYNKKIENEKEKEIDKEKQYEIGSRKRTIKYISSLLLSGILLFLIGNRLGNTLENLCYIFSIPQFIIGILLGFTTSIPELITFIESQKHHKKEDKEILGVIEATNNLFTSNTLNLFVIQAVGILIIQ